MTLFFVGKFGTVYGWGKISPSGLESPKLLLTSVTGFLKILNLPIHQQMVGGPNRDFAWLRKK